MELAWLIASALFRPPHYLHSQLWRFLWELLFNNVCFAWIFTTSCWSVYQKHFHLEDAFQDFNWGNLFVPGLHNKPYKMLSLNEVGHCNACTHRVILICLGEPHSLEPYPWWACPWFILLGLPCSQGAYAENSLLEVILHSWHLWQP